TSVFPSGSQGYIAFRREDRPSEFCWLQPGDLTGIEKLVAEANAEGKMFGLCFYPMLFREPTTPKLENALMLTTVGADLDFKDFGDCNADRTESLDALEAVRSFSDEDCPPTALVRSGHGLHVYYALQVPLFFPHDEQLARELLTGL